MTETDAKNKICPVLQVSIAMLAHGLMGIAQTATTEQQIDYIFGVLDKDDKNCKGHTCMMWDRKRGDCGLKVR